MKEDCDMFVIGWCKYCACWFVPTSVKDSDYGCPVCGEFRNPGLDYKVCYKERKATIEEQVRKGVE